MLKKTFSHISPVLILVLATACSSSANQVNLTAADNGNSVEVKAGGEIVIALDGNPSTGYTWEAKDLDTTLFEQVGDPFFTSSNPGLVGSDGTLTLTFLTLKEGIATLTLIYHRPWETSVDPVETFAVSVTVK